MTIQLIKFNMKYITTIDEKGNKELFIFPKNIDHDAFAEALEFFRNKTHGKWERIHRKPYSAGFILDDKCIGCSESLNLKATKEDTELLHKQMEK